LLLPSQFEPAPVPDDIVVYSRGKGGYWCIKIPYLFTTFAGTLLALGEGRMQTCSDYAWTDLVIKRSTDNGRTWSPLQILHSNSTNPSTNVIGNAASVQDRNSSRILMPFCRNNKEAWMMYSDDDGVTWSEPELIEGVTQPAWTWVGTGPPGALQLRTGRLIVPSYHSTVPNGNGEFSEDHVMYSDDAGKTWQLGGSWNFGVQFPNECQGVELPDGTLFINVPGLGTAMIGAYSTDGGLTVPRVEQISTLIQPLIGCQGSTLLHPQMGVVYFSGLHETSVLRYNLSMHRSYDLGQTWEAYEIVDAGATAYGSLSLLSNGSIALLYEWAKEEKLMFDPDYFSLRIVGQ
jgi:sialidase-1